MATVATVATVVAARAATVVGVAVRVAKEVVVVEAMRTLIRLMEVVAVKKVVDQDEDRVVVKQTMTGAQVKSDEWW